MSSSIVIDTSVVVHSVTDRGQLGIAARHFLGVTVCDLSLLAPPLFLAEAESTFNLWRLREKKTRNRLTLVREKFDRFDVQIIHLEETHAAARKIADDLRLPRVYDATFAALAMLRNVDYYTADVTFYNASHGKYPFVKIV